MLPVKIANLLDQLADTTEQGDLPWIFDDENSKVSTSLIEFDISICYRFDLNDEAGSFRIDIFDKRTNQDLMFHTKQYYKDYELVRRLFDCAQASTFEFDISKPLAIAQ